MKLDILAVGVHPDDVELSCAGTLLKAMQSGRKAGILDLTRGELGTRGTAEIRMKEAAAAAEILGISVRDNLGMADGFFKNDPEHQLRIIEKIRQYQPEIVLCNAITDRHPDHGRASQLVSEACFYAGLRKVETTLDGKPQEAWRPKVVYHYIQDRNLKPDFIVDVSDFAEKKLESILAYASQFYQPGSNEPVTPISSKEFLQINRNRMMIWGREINVLYGEGFTVERAIGVRDLFDLQ
jgi:bacillithiol biosynthesis deacetylase BshB1